MLLIFIFLTFLNSVYCNTSVNCTDVAASQGTKSFIAFIYEKYTKTNDSSVISIAELDKLMKDIKIGRILKRNLNRIHRDNIALAKKLLSVEIDKRKCFNSSDVLRIHNVNASKGVSKIDFLRMCPSFIHEIDSNVCWDKGGKKKHDGGTPSKAQTWGWGFFSITVISFASLALIGIIPFIKKSIYARVMSYLVALAVGTLSGDALLHLIPHAFGEGTNQAISLHVSEADELKQEYSQVWRALFVLLGIYVFFAVELFMKLRGGGHGHSHGNESSGHTHNDGSKNGSIRKPRAPSTKSVTYANEAIEIEIPGHNGDVTKGDLPTYQSGNEVIIYQSQRKLSLRDPGEKQITKETSVRTVAWVVIIGDGFHNFSDGLAIGAAFSASMSSGISTSIAVFCHELPHELGDFAVLLSSGMTMKQAIVYNLVSTILAYAGLTVGILAGGDEIGRHFILSITAGLFLYVSLADLLPELTNEDIPGQSKVCTFITQHLGICTGIGIMLIISLYEHQMGG